VKHEALASRCVNTAAAQTSRATSLRYRSCVRVARSSNLVDECEAFISSDTGAYYSETHEPCVPRGEMATTPELQSRIGASPDCVLAGLDFRKSTLSSDYHRKMHRGSHVQIDGSLDAPAEGTTEEGRW
jgi:hypothetical protein